MECRKVGRGMSMGGNGEGVDIDGMTAKEVKMKIAYEDCIWKMEDGV